MEDKQYNNDGTPMMKEIIYLGGSRDKTKEIIQMPPALSVKIGRDIYYRVDFSFNYKPFYIYATVEYTPPDVFNELLSEYPAKITNYGTATNI